MAGILKMAVTGMQGLGRHRRQRHPERGGDRVAEEYLSTDYTDDKADKRQCTLLSICKTWGLCEYRAIFSVLRAQAGTHPSASAGGAIDSRWSLSSGTPKAMPGTGMTELNS
jgi:hypothetical protein